jgi:uracil phosphoribosyltransferase
VRWLACFFKPTTTSKKAFIKLAPDGLSQITEIYKERKVVVVTPVLADTLGKAITIAKGIHASAEVPDEIKSMKVVALKLGNTASGNPLGHVKVQPGFHTSITLTQDFLHYNG